MKHQQSAVDTALDYYRAQIRNGNAITRTVAIRQTERLLRSPDTDDMAICIQCDLMFEREALHDLGGSGSNFLCAECFGQSNLATKEESVEESVNYVEYMRSPMWKALRDRLLFTRGTACALCDADENEPDVHHLTYARLGREKDEDLLVVCRPCHDRIPHSRDRQTASWDRRLNGWATVVYGDGWGDSPGKDVAEWSFRRWLHKKGEGEPE